MTWSLARLARLVAAVLLLSVALPLYGQALHQPASAGSAASTASAVSALSTVSAVSKVSIVEPSIESQLLSLTDSARAGAGLAPLHSSSTLVSIARTWSAHMAATGQLGHNPGVAGTVSGWASLGENVAKAYSASQAQSLFMGSPDHRANILDAHFNRVGIGVTRAADGSLWVTVDFEQTGGYSPPAASTKPPKHVSPPKPRAGSTTAAARTAAAGRASRSLVRRALPGALMSQGRVGRLSAADAAARAARLGTAEIADLALTSGRLAVAGVPVAPSPPGSPASLIVLAAVTASAVVGAVITQLLVQHRAAVL